MEEQETATVRVRGLGYIAEYFRFGDDEIVHAAVPHVDPLVRSAAPVWLPHVAPMPLCGLGRGKTQRQIVRRTDGLLCRACTSHLRSLDDWVRQAEQAVSV